MKKNLGVKNWMFPMPVLMIGTYGADGKPDAGKMKPICFDTCQHVYRLMGAQDSSIVSYMVDTLPTTRRRSPARSRSAGFRSPRSCRD